jgi:hypothetical protein
MTLFVVANAQILAQLRGHNVINLARRTLVKRGAATEIYIWSQFCLTVEHRLPIRDEADTRESWAQKSITMVAYQFSKLKILR